RIRSPKYICLKIATTDMSELTDPRIKLNISVLIATRDRAKLLENTLDHLHKQVMPGLSWEVMVVDNGSTDDTSSVLERAREKLPLVSLYEPIPGKNRSLNKALKHAQGELLVFTDDDVSPSTEWLAELCRASRQYRDYNLFCGPIYLSYPPDKPDWFDYSNP